jgi:monooxygenase
MMDGPSIRRYISETAERFGVLPRVRFNQRLTALAWSSEAAMWTVTVRDTQSGTEHMLLARFLRLCTGYYRYDEGHRPAFPGEADYRGRFVHPQFRPEDLDWSGRRIVVIGSGATAVTLVPELARHAAHVTQLQRSPSHVVSQPAEDPLARWQPRLVARRILEMARAE